MYGLVKTLLQQLLYVQLLHPLQTVCDSYGPESLQIPVTSQLTPSTEPYWKGSLKIEKILFIL